jgi:CRP-like cAMP-binding protein
MAAIVMKSSFSSKNRILKGLPPRESRIIVPQLRQIWLPKDHVLSEAGERVREVIFPDLALISYLSGTSDGESIEVCIVGNEGAVDLGSLLSQRTAFRAVVQIPGEAHVISTDFLRKEFGRCDVVHRILLNYTGALLSQLAHTAVCNEFHSIYQRFCRWLLLASDRIRSSDIPMTQDAMGRVLGSRRASISAVAGALQRKGFIQYGRGAISILNRKALEAESCECYQTINAAHDPTVPGALRS